MTKNKWIFKSILFALFLAIGTLAYAQTSQGILAGVVRDKTGASLGNVKVTLSNEETKETRSSVTQTDGAYRVDAIPPGRYTVEFEVSGFDTKKATGIIVKPSVVSSYDAVLSVGKVSDVVEVSAVTNAINTENGQLTGIISQNDIQKLPIFSLNPIELATLLPGVQVIVQPGSGAGAQGQVFSANGARPRANNFLIDGQEINDVAIEGQGFQPDIPGMYSNVAVLTNSASAEYGRAGGAVTNVVTTRGSNTIHGTVYERYTGSGLNALSATQRQSKTPTFSPAKSRFDRHTYGFSGGGPIFKDKLFVFGAGQWQRFFGSTLEGRTDLPDANGVAQLKLIQSQTGTIQATQAALFANYLSNYAYLNTFTSTGTINERLGVTAPGCPVGGCIVTTQLFQRPSTPQQNTDTQFATRVDYTPTAKDSFAVRYIHDRSFLAPDFGNNASLPGFDSQQGGFSELAQVGETHVFGPRVLNEFRVSETRLFFQFSFLPSTLANPLIVQPTLSFANNGLPNLGPNQNLPQGRGEDLYQIQDTVGLTFGRQTIRAGADIGRQIEQEYVSQNALGTLSYGSAGTYGGSSLGEFINNYIGTSGSVTKTFGSTRVDPHNWRTGLFIQDDVKLTPAFTLNLGARYDFFSAPENNVAYPAINPATALTDPITAVYKIKTDKNNISPRAGFAYVPHFGMFADGKTVIHGGFGIYFDGDFSNIVVNEVQSSPNAIAYNQTYTAQDGAANSNTLLANAVPVLTPTSSVTTVVNNFVNPYTYQYNLGIERELPFNLKLTTNYVASRGVKLFVNRQYNYFTPTNGTAATTRLNPARGVINARGNFGTSEYNSLQAELSRAYSHGLTFRFSYTLGKDLDNASEVFNTFNSATSYEANLAANGMAQEWGNSAWDHRNNVTFSYVWSPAGFHVENAVANGVLGALTRHWTISGVERFQSGPYSTYSTGVDTNGDGSTANDRPVLSNPAAPFLSAAIDASYFAGGTQGTYYDVFTYRTTGVKTVVDPTTKHFLIQRGQNFLSQEIGRDTYLQPGYQQHDLAIEKGIGLSYLHFERGQLTLRCEANDIGNHNNVAPLGVSVSNIGVASQFNPVISRTVSSRSLVLWAKVTF